MRGLWNKRVVLVALACWPLAAQHSSLRSEADLKVGQYTSQGKGKAANTPTFYKDVLPVVEEHCQVCHRAGGIAPMAFQTYAETRAYAGAIADAVRSRRMPPWFAERGIGHFANDPSLSDAQIALLAAWAAAGAPAGNAAEAPAPKKWA